MISILKQLIENISLAEGGDLTLLETQLNEKRRFVSKKKKKQQALKKQQTQNSTTQQKETPKKYQLIKYNPQIMETTENNEFTPEFISCRDYLAQCLRKYYELIRKADQIWKQAGKDKPCPDDAYKLYRDILNGLQKDIGQFIQNEFQPNMEKMLEVEVRYIYQQLSLTDAFLTKSEKYIDSLNPELFVDKKQLPQTVDNGDVQDNKLTHDKYKTKVDKSTDKIITYDEFEEKYKDVRNIIEEQIRQDEAAKKVANPNDLSKENGPWIERTFWAFIESPVAQDAVKMFMYSNPLTAAIFDGKFGNLGFKDSLNYVKGWMKQQRQQAEKDAEEQRKKNEKKYNKNGVPVSTENLSVNDIKRELYGNKIFCNLINTLYNHPEVEHEDKKTLKDSTEFLNKNLLNKDKFDRATRTQILRNFKQLVDTCNECCEYMNWDNVHDWETIETVKNSNKEEEAIDKATNKKEAKRKETLDRIKEKIKLANYTADDYTTASEYLEKKGFKDSDIDAAWGEVFNKQEESYNVLHKYNQLLECAIGKETIGEIK